MPIRDEDIKVEVVKQLYWDSRVDASEIHVSVRSGEVTLEGFVPSFLSRQAVNEDARSVAGVVSVNNKVMVKISEGSATDAEIESHVKDILKWNAAIDSDRISVSVASGAVTLDGFVDSYWKKVYAEDLADNLGSVVTVNNNLSVVPTKKASDENIAAEIKSALERNASVDDDSVDVKVQHGVVTLSGSVGTWGARTSAFFAALYTSGVVYVDNRLSVGQMQ